MAMVMLETQTFGGAGDDPGAGAVFADMEGDLDHVVAAFANVHDHALAAEGGVGGGAALDHPAGEGLAAQGAEFVPETVLGGGFSCSRQDRGEQQGEEQGYSHATNMPKGGAASMRQLRVTRRAR